MKPIRCALLLLALALAAGCASDPSWPSGESRAKAPRILVTIVQEDQALRGGNPIRRYRRRAGYLRGSEDQVLDALADAYALQRVEGWPISPLGVYCEVYAVSASADVGALLRRMQGDPRVESAQAMQIFQTFSAERGAERLDDMQHALSTMQVREAHRWTRGEGVRVAVIDSWVDDDHPDLRGRVSRMERFTPVGSADSDVHGTAVAGVIAAEDNRVGITGVAPGARLMALQACWVADGAPGKARCDTFSLAKALTAGIEQEAQVINLSLGGPEDPLLRRLIDQAIARGAFVVAAASPRWTFPASVPGVFAVGSEVAGSLRAPGIDVLTTVPGAGYGFLSGSSIAAAHASGVIALLLEIEPELRHPALEALMERASGDGELNACHAVYHLTDGRACDPRSVSLAGEG